MTTRLQQLCLLAALPILIAGCATAKAADPPAAVSPQPSSSPPAPATANGTSLADATLVATPSESATMVCGAEIRTDVATILALRTPPSAATSWVDQLYTCTYQLPNGPLAVSVKESGNAASARGYFDELRRRLGSTQTLRGLDSLGLPAFETPNGNVAFLKDDKTLQVDATKLPREVNAQHRQRDDLAYTVATDILGCWSGK